MTKTAQTKSPLMEKDESYCTTVSIVSDDQSIPEFIGNNNSPLKIPRKGSTIKLVTENKIEMEIIVDGDNTDDNTSTTDSGSSSNDSNSNNGLACMKLLHKELYCFYNRYKQLLRQIMYVVLVTCFMIYLATALVKDVQRAMGLLIITVLVVVGYIYTQIRNRFGKRIWKSCCQPATKVLQRNWTIIKWCLIVLVIIAIIVELTVDVKPKADQLISLGGLVMFLGFLFLFSKHPSKVKWRPVLWGIGLQVFLGVIILRTKFGYEAFKSLGEEAHRFLNYSDAGASFVFGKETYEDHFFAFKVLPVVVFFSCVISTLYYLGVMQCIICKIAWLMQITMGTTATESLTAAGNIFVGQTEAPILVRPFIRDMTRSELHAMMTGGFATIAGGVLAAYILFGVPAEHLLCASVMNAPIALAISKLFYPETEVSIFSGSDIPMDKGKERNVLEAASSGASASISLVANIAANLIAFLAMLAFINATLSWFGSMVDCPQLSFQLICSYIFMPVAFMMGVEWEYSGIVGELLGTKLFLNEFVAYKELSKYIKNREACIQPFMSVRAETIATYALCGFANLSSIGIQLGGIGPMAPEKKGVLASIAVRALIAGFISCLVTACVAGLLTVNGEFIDCSNVTMYIGNHSSLVNQTHH